jgi:hypothetical protein
VDDPADLSFGDVVLDGEVTIAGTQRSAPADLAHIVRGESSVMVPFATYRLSQPSGVGMLDVSARGEKFEVGKAVVGLDAIPVIDLKVVGDRAVNGFPYDDVGVAPENNRSFTNGDLHVARRLHDRTEWIRRPAPVNESIFGVYKPLTCENAVLGDGVFAAIHVPNSTIFGSEHAAAPRPAFRADDIPSPRCNVCNTQQCSPS